MTTTVVSRAGCVSTGDWLEAVTVTKTVSTTTSISVTYSFLTCFPACWSGLAMVKAAQSEVKIIEECILTVYSDFDIEIGGVSRSYSERSKVVVVNVLAAQLYL
jgi:hypothetical protein